MTFRRLCIAIAPLLVAACGGGGSVSQADFASQYANAYCSKIIGCCQGTANLPTEAACVAAATSSFQTDFSAAIADTNVSYNGSAASSCFSEIGSASCGDLEFTGNVDTPDCNLVLTGKLANGQPCTTNSNGTAPNECQSGLCINVTYNGTVGTGVCAAQGAIGAACPTYTNEADGSICVTGSYTSYGATASQCTCAAVQANGASCTTDGPSSCSSGYCDTTTNPNAAVCANAPTAVDASFCTQLTTGN